MSKLSIPSLTPFDAATRQTKRSYGSIDLTNSSGVPYAMPKTGFLGKITLNVGGTMTVTLGGGTAALDPILGPWGILNRIVLSINGSKQVYNADGLMSYGLLNTLGEALTPDDGLNPTPAAHAASIYSVPVAAGANAWALPFVIPVAPNDDELLGGFVNMYDALQASLTLTKPGAMYSTVPGVAPVLVTGAAVATFAGQAGVTAETFDIPAEQLAAFPPGGFLHVINQTQQGISNVGEQTVKLENEGVYLQILHHLALNGAGSSTAFDALALGSQFSYKHYDMTKAFVLWEQRMRYKRDLPAGFLDHNLFYQGDVNMGGWRDVFDAATVADFRSFITISSGATLGTNPTIRTLTRLLEPVPTSARPRV